MRWRGGREGRGSCLCSSAVVVAGGGSPSLNQPKAQGVPSRWNLLEMSIFASGVGNLAFNHSPRENS